MITRKFKIVEKYFPLSRYWWEKVFYINAILFVCHTSLAAVPPPVDQARAERNPDFYLHVEFTGILRYVVFPGRPNFVSVEDGDDAEPRWILDVDEQSLQRLVGTKASATPENYAYEYIDTSLQGTEPGAHLVTLDSFTEEPDYLELFENKKITVEGVVSAQPAHGHTPYVVEVVKVISYE